MGFPSPAQDYVEQRIDLNNICGLTPTTCVIPTSTGYVIVETQPARVEQGNTLVISCSGTMQLVRLHGRAFITTDGDAYEGEAMEDITVMGVVTFMVYRAGEEDNVPVI